MPGTELLGDGRGLGETTPAAVLGSVCKGVCRVGTGITGIA